MQQPKYSEHCDFAQVGQSFCFTNFYQKKSICLFRKGQCY